MRSEVILPLLLLLVPSLILGLFDPKVRENRWRLPVATVVSCAVVILPLVLYLFSELDCPDWKGGCPHGWLDCLMVAKLAFAPFVLAATVALYRVEVLRHKDASNPWIVLPIFLGAIISTACVGWGLWSDFDEYRFWYGQWDLLVPVYIVLWYVGRSIYFIAKTPIRWTAYIASLAALAPSWFGAVVWAKHIYQSLPDKQPQGCFVVTAALRGHEAVVGPFFVIEHEGQTRLANRQLITFWQFETVWRSLCPLSHRLFRRIYNRLGPVLAARIRRPWLADAAFLALKPLEVAARQGLRLVNLVQSRFEN